MKILLFAYLIVFIACTTKNSNLHTDEQLTNTHESSLHEKTISNDSTATSVFLNSEFTGNIQIYNDSQQVIMTVGNDLENENIVMFQLLGKNDSMFHVIAYWSINHDFIAEGWIDKNNQLGIFSSAYNKDFILYNNPYNRDKIVVIDKEYNPEVYKVTDFEGSWLKIKAKIKNKFYDGWIPPEMQCSNVYSTCN